MTQTPTQVRDLLARHDVRPRKRLGQHFLADPNVTAKIASLAPEGDPILEIGAGTGSLTVALVAAGHHVLTYELDERLRPVLQEVLEGIAEVDLRFEDVTEADLGEALNENIWTLVANLPYHIGTPLLLDLLRNENRVHRYVVMVQKEVADRLVAAPGGKQYGVPSIVTQLFAVARHEFDVPARLFVPPPRVASSVLTLGRRPEPGPAAETACALAASAFQQRRKMIKTSLAGALADVSILQRAGVDGRLRADDLAPEDYLAIAEVSR